MTERQWSVPEQWEISERGKFMGKRQLIERTVIVDGCVKTAWLTPEENEKRASMIGESNEKQKMASGDQPVQTSDEVAGGNGGGS